MNWDKASGRILLAVTGLSCQVVTETIYALAQQDRNMLPDAVYVLTTREGAERARLLLCQEGWFGRLLRDWELPSIAFGPEHIQIIHDARERPLGDIRSQQDNVSAADTIAEAVRMLTTSNTKQLHVSIAGGRKTMGFFAGYALTLYGRPQDRLSHVLVSSEFESHPDFYYPTPYPRVIHTAPPTSKPLDTRDATVELAEIPFLRLRARIEPVIQQAGISFYQAVAATQKQIDPPSIAADLETLPVFVLGDTPISLPPVECAFYFWLLVRLARGLELSCPAAGVYEPRFAKEFLSIHDCLLGQLGHDRTRERLADGMDKDFFEQTKSRLQNSIKRALLPEINPAPYLLERKRNQQRWIYTLQVDPQRIQLKHIPPQAWQP